MWTLIVLQINVIVFTNKNRKSVYILCILISRQGSSLICLYLILTYPFSLLKPITSISSLTRPLWSTFIPGSYLGFTVPPLKLSQSLLNALIPPLVCCQDQMPSPSSSSSMPSFTDLCYFLLLNSHLLYVAHFSFTSSSWYSFHHTCGTCQHFSIPASDLHNRLHPHPSLLLCLGFLPPPPLLCAVFACTPVCSVTSLPPIFFSNILLASLDQDMLCASQV